MHIYSLNNLDMVSSLISLVSDSRTCKRKVIGKAIYTLLTVVILEGCTAGVDQRGQIFDNEDMETLRIGVTSKTEVFNQLGSPTILPIAGGDSWYYVNANIERFAFYKSAITQRQIIALHFDEDMTISRMEVYSLADGRKITFIEEATPSRGRDLGIIEEIFGNIGRFTPAGTIPQP